MKKTIFRISLSLLGYIFLSTSFAAAQPQYSLIIDAGSRGSRVHLFEYTKDEALPNIHELFSAKTTPGLSSFANNPTQAGESLKPLLDGAIAELAKRNIDTKTVRLDVLATAGMRLLPTATQKLIFDNVKTFTASYDFRLNRAETITGKEEGLFGWLDVNYLAGHFYDPTRDDTVGSIDMGGASTEIAFSTTTAADPKDTAKLSVGGKSYTVFSKSFLGLGQDTSREEINKNPATAIACYPIDFPLDPSHAGAFNLANCTTNYANLITANNVAKSIPALHPQTFIAYSGAYYTYHFFDADMAPSKNNLLTKVQTACSDTWEQLKAKHPNDDEKYVQGYCASAVYMSALFYDAYKIQDSQFVVMKNINSHEIDWTLGALLFELL